MPGATGPFVKHRQKSKPITAYGSQGGLLFGDFLLVAQEKVTRQSRVAEGGMKTSKGQQACKFIPSSCPSPLGRRNGSHAVTRETKLQVK